MPSGEHETLRGLKRKSHFRVTTGKTEPTGKQDSYGDDDYQEVVRYYDREHYIWYVLQHDDNLYVGLRDHLTTAHLTSGYNFVATFHEWESVEDCDAPTP